ncbi:hypothetical protein I5677_00475 [Mobilitalea sibirica]|uniref:protein-tyrosine-phosphatase n=1 Tax=Mobilitalea sibirica TaxID=1462919 RepID=A0A8J7H4E8_9FIRM|nr:CpsB/CapC family capsule biosynthesis tyrosine phosphatase [Mobilitalea sibirica]MBH1939361.1 hypothetical protein [Mobilitalea sibirica]
MQGYCDIHCHILPGVDDGAKDMEETCRMLSIAYNEGLRTIVMTPHYYVGMERIPKDRLLELKKKVGEAAQLIDKEFKLFLGNEILYFTDIINALKRGEALTINDTRYILVEFLAESTFREIWKGLSQCIHAGYIPILAHAERYLDLVNKPDFVHELIKLGAYIQINLSSTVRRFSKRTSFCHKLIKRGWVHFLGTDSHGADERSPIAKAAIKRLQKKYGEGAVYKIMKENPMRMLENKII